MPETVHEGLAHKFGHNIDTDQIYPARYIEITDPEEMGQHAMSGIEQSFAGSFRAGNIVIAGRNFGCGSSREHAVRSLKQIGVGVLIAESFARIFYRNAINLGLPAVRCPGVWDMVSNGDRVRVDLSSGSVTNLVTGARLEGEGLPVFVLKIFEAGGVVPLRRQDRLDRSSPSSS